jgi:SAM-dependent methyltransferase
LRRRYLIFIALLVLFGCVTVVATLTLSFGLASLIALASVLLLGYYLWNCRLTVMFEPAPLAAARCILEMLCVQPGEVVYDLGCGDARMLILAARRYGARGVGVEIDLLRVLLARLLVCLWGVSRQVDIYHADINDAELSTADIVVLFLSPEVNSRLKSKLAEELRPTARVVSYQHCIPGWKPKVQRSFSQDGGLVFLYVGESWRKE